jgi:hypothetical protein
MCVISEPVIWTDPFSQQGRAYVAAQTEQSIKGVFVLSEDVAEDDFNYYLLRHLEQHVEKAIHQTGTEFAVCGVTLNGKSDDQVRFNHILSQYSVLDKQSIADKLCTNPKYQQQFKDFIGKLSSNVDPSSFVCFVVKYR